MFEYDVYNNNGEYIVRLKALNRYAIFIEPAFKVMDMLSKDIDTESIIDFCMKDFKLPYNKALDFVKEVSETIDTAFLEKKEIWQPVIPDPASIKLESPYSKKCYKINNKTILFHFGDKDMEYLVHPLFSHFETEFSNDKADAFIELFKLDEKYIYKLNNSELTILRENNTEEFQGSVCMELANIIHNKKSCDWMGVIHASAVSDGNSSLLFVAPSGMGKSTIAALMMANGYSVLSDDFVPIAIEKPEVYSFPAAMSVKSTSLALMKKYFPTLPGPASGNGNGSEVYETYMPLPQSGELLSPVEAKAIIFIQYDKNKKYELTRLPNIGAMEEFMRQSWINISSAAAEFFMEWFYNMPVYLLKYSNNSKMIKKIKRLF